MVAKDTGIRADLQRVIFRGKVRDKQHKVKLGSAAWRRAAVGQQSKTLGYLLTVGCPALHACKTGAQGQDHAERAQGCAGWRLCSAHCGAP